MTAGMQTRANKGIPHFLVTAITPFNHPLIVLDDADIELVVHLAAEGCFRERSTSTKCRATASSARY